MYSIYVHINKLNHKMYFGITKQNPKRRFRDGEGYKSCTKFYKAIQKYGWDNFEHIIIKTDMPKECAETLEKILIYKYDTINSGYNLDGGGNLHLATKESKIKSSESHKGKKLSQSTKDKLRISTTELWKDPIYRSKCQSKKGRNVPPVSENTKEKISDSIKKLWLNDEYVNKCKKGLETYHKMHSKPIRAINEDEVLEFDSVSEAVRYLNKTDRSGIYRTVGTSKKAYGYRWEYI